MRIGALSYETLFRAECSETPATRKNQNRNLVAGQNSVSLQKALDAHVVFLKAGANMIEGIVDSIGKLKHLVLVLADSACAHHGFPVQDFIPILLAVDENDVVLW